MIVCNVTVRSSTGRYILYRCYTLHGVKKHPLRGAIKEFRLTYDIGSELSRCRKKTHDLGNQAYRTVINQLIEFRSKADVKIARKISSRTSVILAANAIVFIVYRFGGNKESFGVHGDEERAWESFAILLKTMRRRGRLKSLSAADRS